MAGADLERSTGGNDVMSVLYSMVLEEFFVYCGE